MKSMQIDVPDDLNEYVPELRHLFQSMVYKLNNNRHKGFIRNIGVGDLFKGITAERIELLNAIDDESLSNMLAEGVDVANMAVLMGIKCLRITKEEI